MSRDRIKRAIRLMPLRDFRPVHTLLAILRIALGTAMLLLPLSVAADLNPAIQADLYLVMTEEYMKEKNYVAAQETMGKILDLQKEHGLTLPDEFHFKYGQVLELAESYSKAIESLNLYLESAGQSGTYYREALLLLHRVSEMNADLQKQDHEAYEQAQAVGTAAAYGEYLRTYPTGQYAEEARQQQGDAEAREDDQAFELAQRAGTAAAYGAYLREYSNGVHSEEAGRLQAVAQDHEAYERAEAARTAAAYGEYLRTYRTGRHAEEARGRHTAARKAEAIAERRRSGRRFRDCGQCPHMVVVPAGTFLMGSRTSEEGRDGDEGPVHRVSLGEPFAVGVYEATFAEWDSCVAGGGCDGYRPDDRGLGRGRRPVSVSRDDAKRYVEWLSRKTGETYRLLSEAEWEYVARAGSQTAYYTGATISKSQANYDGKGRVPVGRFSPNAFGLYDIHGNVSEWVEDCYHWSYEGAPTDGSGWVSGQCFLGQGLLRGGSWDSSPRRLRSADRNRQFPGYRDDNAFGFRIAREIE